MPSIASVTGSTPLAGRWVPRSPQTTCAPNQGGGAGPSQATRGGLVICAKSVRDTAEGVDAELSAADALGLGFPSPDSVASAAALFDRAQLWAQGRDRLDVEPQSGRFRIAVGPGVVRLGWTSPVRAEKASERAVNRHRLDVAAEEDRIKRP